MRPRSPIGRSDSRGPGFNLSQSLTEAINYPPGSRSDDCAACRHPQTSSGCAAGRFAPRSSAICRGRMSRSSSVPATSRHDAVPTSSMRPPYLVVVPLSSSGCPPCRVTRWQGTCQALKRFDRLGTRRPWHTTFGQPALRGEAFVSVGFGRAPPSRTSGWAICRLCWWSG
jgi:hypothetical protein